MTYEKTDFPAWTPRNKKQLFTGGPLQMFIEGNRIINDNHVPDPALTIAAMLSPAIAEKLQATDSFIIAGQKARADSASKLAKAAGSSGVVFDVKTIGWSLSYLPNDSSHFSVEYWAQARLIDAKAEETLWVGMCKYNSDHEETALTRAQILEDQAAILKAKLAAAASGCVGALQTNILGAWRT